MPVGSNNNRSSHCDDKHADLTNVRQLTELATLSADGGTNNACTIVIATGDATGSTADEINMLATAGIAD